MGLFFSKEASTTNDVDAVNQRIDNRSRLDNSRRNDNSTIPISTRGSSTYQPNITLASSPSSYVPTPSSAYHSIGGLNTDYVGYELDYSDARYAKTRAKQIQPVSVGRGRELSTKDQPWHPENSRSFGNYKCECGACWSSAYSWADETQACKHCGTDVLAYKQRPLKKSSADKPTAPHRQDLCGKCQSLGRLCALSMEKSTSSRHYNDVVVKGLPLDITEQRLKETFRAYGAILRVYMPPENPTFSSRVAFITFQNPESALRKFNDVDVRATYQDNQDPGDQYDLHDRYGY